MTVILSAAVTVILSAAVTVILSTAKDLLRLEEMFRFAQHDGRRSSCARA